MASAETKRQPNTTTGSKVATPKPAGNAQGTAATPAAQPPADLDHALTRAIGARVRVVVAAPQTQTLEGVLFTTDRETNIVAISAAPSSLSQSGDFHLIHTSRIQSFSILSLAADVSKNVPPMGPIDIEEAEKREAAAITSEKEKEQRRKNGVTSDAEELYIAVGRMLPIRWAGAQMVVNENVLINPPFRPEDCQAAKGNESGLARVKKVVENERRKYSERNKSPSAQPARKGG